MGPRTQSGGFRTTEGTLYVSKPFRSKSSKKLRAMITFAPRKSAFDTTNEFSGANEFRGFFTLFWISIFLFTIQTYISSFEANGYALSFAFATMFSRDAITLALSDALLVLTTAICVPFAILISKGWIRYYSTGLIIQHVFQTCMLVTAVTWTFNRQWPWVQSGYLTLHTLVMIMKMHSYMTINGYLQHVSTRSKELLEDIRRVTLEVGGWDQALSDAKARHEETETDAHTTDSNGISTPNDTPAERDGNTVKSFTDAPTAAALRHRLVAISGSGNTGVSTPSVDPTFMQESSSPNGNHDYEIDDPPAYMLVDHPDERISALAKEYKELDSELVSTGPSRVRWPENISIKNFALYQLTPTLVYELEYPRTDRIRPLYVFEKTVGFMGTFALLYSVTENFIIPLTPTPDQSFFRSLLDLALPFMIAYLLLFYIIFECICNGFAELSYFADRQFYEDWWNSTSWDEFSRKWNKPVHSFLLRHVYASTLASYKVSRTTAMFVTFLLSAAAHELVMTVVTKKIRMYLFLLQLIQIPLIMVSRMPAIKRNKLMGNVVFWLGLYAGFPLLCVAYVAY
ncbi:hypothetical protein SERLA73DRAFT_58578 [Serpula lacrymans var. lacrymans S7.3]|uniref:O-acyltransferase n=2 Tax=Serpula lacrymans var. lacrymans TaxID=341189 RepID=F8Q3W0_SERL3|nr:uncharacterized protein SERLADRAFT_350480 [Serpula lacrymans var. lacrymans S7.9]EGN96816.1 hypothetical protein SERLA73DRAFT_58578 [Serpula lacrymans var. lacrymans S7.3]EGO22414.1 hypothetical protein SERLADRAFT_350480 [Serpula lacrymans var. lacrymans S7.9]